MYLLTYNDVKLKAYKASQHKYIEEASENCSELYLESNKSKPIVSIFIVNNLQIKFNMISLPLSK